MCQVMLFLIYLCKIQQSTSTRDVVWHSLTSVFGWNVQGLYSIKGDEEYPSIQSVAVDPTMSIVISCDAKGITRAFNYPCQSPGAKFTVLSGISTTSHRMVFTKDGMWLLVVDALTRTILQFRVLSL